VGEQWGSLRQRCAGWIGDRNTLVQQAGFDLDLVFALISLDRFVVRFVFGLVSCLGSALLALARRMSAPAARFRFA
jgi:hypothetical protein